MDKPRYQHDCTACTYLGQYKEFDLYFCPQGGNIPTVIARYGNDGPEYQSGLVPASVLPELAEARKRAITAGLLRN
jgi:hypothetical protein